MLMRLRSSWSAAALHLACSAVVAALAATLVFGLWYPYPYREISGGRELFVLLLGVDVALGPALTLFVFAPSKPRAVWLRDLAVIVFLQLAALAYGLYSVAEARPVRLVAEGNRFRVVSKAELADQPIQEAPEALREWGWQGPVLIGARLAQATDKDYLASVQASVAGLHPGLRPSRWIPYDEAIANVKKDAKPLAELIKKRPEQAQQIRDALNGAPETSRGYLPLVSRTHDNWVVLIDLNTGLPVSSLPVDGW